MNKLTIVLSTAILAYFSTVFVLDSVFPEMKIFASLLMIVFWSAAGYVIGQETQ